MHAPTAKTTHPSALARTIASGACAGDVSANVTAARSWVGDTEDGVYVPAIEVPSFEKSKGGEHQHVLAPEVVAA